VWWYPSQAVAESLPAVAVFPRAVVVFQARMAFLRAVAVFLKAALSPEAASLVEAVSPRPDRSPFFSSS
jgi:hypothetical protein